MISGRLRAADYLLWTAALAWPLGVFTQTPVPGLDVLTLLAILIAFVVVPDAIADRKLRVPMEAWAPSAAIGIFAVAWSWSGPAPRNRDVIAALILFVLVLQSAPSRDAIRRYLFAASVSITLVTLVSLLTPWLGLFPTAYTFRSGAALSFPYTLAEGLQVLLIGAAIDFYIASERRYGPAQRAWATGSMVLLATLLMGEGIQWTSDTGALPSAPYPVLRADQWVAAALALWLVARVLAKIEVDRRAAPDPLHRLWWMVAIVSVIVAALAPLHPRAYQGVILGLACATAMPSRINLRSTRWPVVASGMLCVFVVANLVVVFPGNENDPRQYDAAARREAPRVFDRMDWVDRHAPRERRTYLWRARGALDSGLPSLASFAFERATRMVEGATVLSPPTEAERQRFLVAMRDAVATLPEDRAVCAYERVLLANGERDSALYSLRLQTSVALMHAPVSEASLFTPVVALILGDPSIAEDLRAWNADDVLTLLSHWGTDTSLVADRTEAPGGVFILAGQRTWDSLAVLVRVGDRVTRFEEALAPVTQRDIERLQQVSTMVWAGPGEAGASGEVRYTLNVVTRGAARAAAYVDLKEDGAAEFAWAADPPAIDFTPAVRVRLAP